MGEYNFKELFDQYPDVISQMPSTFTSHQFILRLAQQNQCAYIEALHAYRKCRRNGKPAPFMMVHGVLARRLSEYGNLLEEVATEVPSKDIFGNDNTASQWRKRC